MSQEVDTTLEHSALEREIERDGNWVKVLIYRGVGDAGWILEVEDQLGGSTVWDDPFDTDQGALDAALRAIEEDGIESFAHAESDPRSARSLWALKTELPPLAEIKRTLNASTELLNFHAVCGLFAAIGTAPELVPPSAWFELIKGKHVFDDLKSAQTLTQGLMALYSEILSSIADHGAHCCPDPSDEEAIREFCAGYAGMALRDASWSNEAGCSALMFPILVLSGTTSMDKLAKLVPAAAQDPLDYLLRAREGLPDIITELYEYWAEERRAAAQRLIQRAEPVRREAIKVGRNSPCPCGSGKKFKKCCAN